MKAEGNTSAWLVRETARAALTLGRLQDTAAAVAVVSANTAAGAAAEYILDCDANSRFFRSARFCCSTDVDGNCNSE